MCRFLTPYRSYTAEAFYQVLPGDPEQFRCPKFISVGFLQRILE
jgi:hypothetical protein